jgi:predicted amidohydrolase
VAGVYRKTHLFGEERERFVPGDSLAPVELAGRRLGPMICFDVEFPEVARTLARRAERGGR